jgi:hypothetical protein
MQCVKHFDIRHLQQHPVLEAPVHMQLGARSVVSS